MPTMRWWSTRLKKVLLKSNGCLFLGLILGLMLGSVHVHASNLDWIELSDQSQASWASELDTHMGGRLTLKQRQDIAVPQNNRPFKLLALVPKKSNSYNQALSALLETLVIERVRATVTLLNFSGDSKRGLAALRYAEDQGYDLIFSMGSESAALMSEHYAGGRLPVVTSTNKDPVLLSWVQDYKSGSGNNIAYTSLNVPVDVQAQYIFELKPNLKNIALLYNKNHAQVVATEVVPWVNYFTELGVNVLEVEVSSRSSAREELTDALPNAVRTMKRSDFELDHSLFWITSSTAIFSNIDLIARRSFKVPVLSSIPNIVKDGFESAVMAIGIDRRNNAQLASYYALKILLQGVDPGSLEVGVVTPADVAINFGVARKIGLKIPFRFFESAAFVYDYEGMLVRAFGERIVMPLDLQ